MPAALCLEEALGREPAAEGHGGRRLEEPAGVRVRDVTQRGHEAVPSDSKVGRRYLPDREGTSADTHTPAARPCRLAPSRGADRVASGAWRRRGGPTCDVRGTRRRGGCSG